MVQGYPASKALAEKAAWKFAEENHIDLITVIPTLTAGPSLTPDIPVSVGIATSLITGSKACQIQWFKRFDQCQGLVITILIDID